MPPANRDISVAVPEDIDAEGIGDLIREGLRPQILESVEQVITIGETPRAELPAQAIDRIGLQPGQKNVLLRLVLRHPTRTLTAPDANRIRDRVYAAIHQGTVSQWASPREE
jgi:phenylalanyl-tRNA synthetase alpha chain